MARDAERLRAALEELGFDRGELELSSSSWYAGPSVLVQVDPAELPDAAEQVENVSRRARSGGARLQDVSQEILDAVEELRCSTGDTGVWFSIDVSSSPPRGAAGSGGRRGRAHGRAGRRRHRARSAEEVVEISGGGFVAAEADVIAGTVTGGEPCDPDAIIAGVDPYGGDSPLKPLDAEPETSVSSVVPGRAAG
jgi:hypothetical protein